MFWLIGPTLEPWRLSRKGVARARHGSAAARRIPQQALEGAVGPGFRVRIAEEPSGLVEGEERRVEVVRELAHVEIRAEPSRRDGALRGGGDHLDPAAVHPHEVVAHRARAVVVLDRRGDEQAATGQTVRRPLEPALEQRAKGLDRVGAGARRGDDDLAEVLDSAFEDRELQGVFRLEVRVQSALREAEPLGEAAYRETVQPDDARVLQGFVEDRLSRLMTFVCWRGE
jgi:hypothetical protein